MANREKLVQRILNNPTDVRFDDACKVAEWLGFIGKGGKGDHAAFSRPGEPIGLNFQNRGGKIKPYQGRQLKTMIEVYWDDAQGDDDSNEAEQDE